MMDLADMTPGPVIDADKRWQKNLVARIRRSALNRRVAFVASIESLQVRHLRRHSDTEVIRILADLARVDWLYNRSTGEVRFFEFM